MKTFFASIANRIFVGAILGLALLAGLLVLTVRGQNTKLADLRTENSAQAAQLLVVETNLAAHETAGVERAADTAQIVQSQEDLTDAIQSVPDTAPDAVRVALGCQRLRRAGGLDASLPAACRSGGGGEARPDS